MEKFPKFIEKAKDVGKRAVEVGLIAGATILPGDTEGQSIKNTEQIQANSGKQTELSLGQDEHVFDSQKGNKILEKFPYNVAESESTKPFELGSEKMTRFLEELKEEKKWKEIDHRINELKIEIEKKKKLAVEQHGEAIMIKDEDGYKEFQELERELTRLKNLKWEREEEIQHLKPKPPLYDKKEMPNPGDYNYDPRPWAKDYMDYYDEWDKNAIEDFYSYYMRTPEYRERLKRTGYDEDDIKDVVKKRLKRLQSLEVKDDIGVLRPPVYRPSTGEIIDNSSVARNFMGFNDQAQYLPHEYSHAFQKIDNADEYKLINERNSFWRAFNEGEDVEEHMWSPSETKADIDQARFDLWRYLKKDPGTKVTMEDIENMKTKLPQTTPIKRLFERFDEKDLLFLMNAIAANESLEKTENPNSIENKENTT